jgi:hypothetical protein
MKKLLFMAALITTVLISCSKKCDNNCGVGGICDNGTCVCLNGYEGENCETQSANKFIGSYNTNYTGTGGLNGTSGNTTMTITNGSGAGKIQISIPLTLNATVPIIGALELPVNLKVQADVVGNQYTITRTGVGFTIPPGLLPIPIPFDINIEYEGTGTLNGNTLTSNWTFTGFVAGNLSLTGTR